MMDSVSESNMNQIDETLMGLPLAKTPSGQKVVFTDVDKYHDLISYLFNEGFNFASDLCGVDYLTNFDRKLPVGVKAERFEVVVNLLSHAKKERIRVRAMVKEVDPLISTVVDIYPGVENMEREAFDMYGIVFKGHPDMTRILMPEGWEGHPLRKDYSTGRVPVQFKESLGPR